MATPAVNQDKLIEKIKTAVQERLDSLLAQVRSYVEPMRGRVIALEKKVDALQQDNDTLKQQLTDITEALKFLRSRQTSAAVDGDRMLKLGGEVSGLRRSHSETRGDIERLWVFLLQMHPDIESDFRDAGIRVQRSAIALNMLRQAKPEMFEREEKPLVYRRKEDYQDTVEALRQINDVVGRLKEKEGE